MLNVLFGSKCREQVLQFILANDTGYATQIKNFYTIEHPFINHILYN